MNAESKDKGITLAESQRDDLIGVLNQVNIALVSIHSLATNMVIYSGPDSETAGDNSAADHASTAIENIAKVCCRKVDLVAQALGDSGFGNFEGEFRSAYTEAAPERG